ncbi:3-oxoacyl-ACP synthase [Ktedonobacter racemifer]|uniref:Beta-ketoacyl-acyl-carrier-protein synthase I n=1 Tax=Ktedonobacter racemifer DSM 44963 TaxID=485913 RepID=D6TSR4_KTERA|nr:3-oxoacyl-ACP synthase [Ktedonobacter racemifer]EFH83465.1 Beta-ketoacyl-acyl-carrier-protein synthase I [Ktedonobacter racemifer DSM 44963]
MSLEQNASQEQSGFRAIEGENGGQATTIGLVAFATYLPEQVQDAAYIAEQSGIPEEVVRKKLGIEQKRRASYEDQTSVMAVRAAQRVLELAALEPGEIDLVLYSGSMHKDFYVWSAANRIQHLLGAKNAYAFELAALCTTNVLALKVARDLMRSDTRLHTVLICGGHRTADLIDFREASSRFLFNLSDGGSAMLLRRDYALNQVLDSAFITDGSLAEDVIIPAGGTRRPTSRETLEQGLHTFHIPDTEHLRQGLDLISEQRFVQVVSDAVERSGYRVEDVDLLAINHMKPSMHRRILSMLHLSEEQSIYLSDYGHIGAPDQVLALELAQQRDMLRPGQLVVLASAGLGFTWGATALRWG